MCQGVGPFMAVEEFIHGTVVTHTARGFFMLFCIYIREIDMGALYFESRGKETWKRKTR